MNPKFEIDGYCFSSRSDYERAKKEKETILYLSEHTNMADRKAVYKIYKQAVEKRSFQTVFGLQYLENLRKSLLNSSFVSEELLEPIPVAAGVKKEPALSSEYSQKQIEKYKEEAQKAKSGRLIKNFLILVLALVIAAMIFITYHNQYSIFTYFTDYKEDMREELVDEYEAWESELDERESELDEREEEVQKREDALGK